MNGNKWEGTGYNFEGIKIFDLKDGKGKIKEYNEDGILIFEGELNNGKKWNGTIYDMDRKNKYVIKEGNSKIQKYNSSNKLIFDGNYVNGHKEGNAYDENGKLKFKGFYIQNKKWSGDIYDINGEICDIIQEGKKVSEICSIF